MMTIPSLALYVGIIAVVGFVVYRLFVQKKTAPSPPPSNQSQLTDPLRLSTARAISGTTVYQWGLPTIHVPPLGVFLDTDGRPSPGGNVSPTQGEVTSLAYQVVNKTGPRGR